MFKGVVKFARLVQFPKYKKNENFTFYMYYLYVVSYETNISRVILKIMDREEFFS